MRSCVVIPARLESSRLSRKLLLSETGKSVLRHTFEAAKKSVADEIVIACDSDLIIDEIQTWTDKPIICKTNYCNSGTDRVAIAISDLGLSDYVVVNWQGDEPLVDPSDVDCLIARCSSREIATIAEQITDDTILQDCNAVKVVLDRNDDAIYFSRFPVPSYNLSVSKKCWLKHIGVYAFAPGVIQKVNNLPQCELECAEKLEQLRFLYNGFTINVTVTGNHSIGIDTMSDYKRFIGQMVC